MAEQSNEAFGCGIGAEGEGVADLGLSAGEYDNEFGDLANLVLQDFSGSHFEFQSATNSGQTNTRRRKLSGGGLLPSCTNSLNPPNSVFECLVDEEALKKMRQMIRRTIKPKLDQVRIYRLCEACLKRVWISAASEEVLHESVSIVV
jgi:hypothetical protein